MYPTINLVGENTFNPLHAPYPTPGSSSAAAAAPQPPSPPQPARANGPPGGPPPAAFPTLQVAIDPKFCLAPPVKAPSQPPGEGGPVAGGAAPPPPPGHPAPGSSQPLDLDLERKLLAELKAGGSSNGSSGAGGSGTGSVQDPYETLVRQFTDMGFTRDELAMGLAIAGPDAADNTDKIAESCRKFQRLASMGFKSEQIVGALILANGDETVATETCLDAAS
ncbi:hypothetical protein C2E21_4294 [Chlorella sorokiniana]|uniref:UBA domain-containing protein n=1 Tax=Chlorella sorokiniana TaxID=3076 RepID=A0A2P6TTN8_CHLSO|nr:hypothetical protein C2E21_4294 [Chlorella sorokiniana]PRW57433.1 hypothetical protein C2E21_4294 [Chlorella sorokiniana]|eukprot:PRW57432.1 hypothetical protein C2E21_4294 [Chlorella sorokiniana]